MKRSDISGFMFVFAFVFVLLSFTLIAEAQDKHKDDIITGNVICLLPNHAKGTVTPVVASGPCHGLQPHAHVILDTRTPQGYVYAVNGSPEAIKRLEMQESRTKTKVKGQVSGSNRGWILTVED